MSFTSRARSITRRVLKIQRRIALTEALFWPVVLGTGVVAGAVVLRSRRQRTSGTADSTAPAA